MAGIRIEGKDSGNIAEVDSLHNLNVVTPIDEANSGFVTLSSEVDDGYITGSRLTKALEATNDYRLRVGIDTPCFNEVFPSTTLNTSIWTTPTGTMTAVITGGWMVLNSGSSTTNGHYAILQTWRSFPVLGTFGVYYESVCSITQTPQTNNITEWGAAIATGTSAPTDGAFFRLTSTGTLRCVLSYGGSETLDSGPALDFNYLIGINTSRHYIITVTDDNVAYWIDDQLVAMINRPAANPFSISSGSLPAFFRTYNTGAVSTAQQIKIGQVTITIGDAATGKPWSHIMAGAGQSLYQNPSSMTVGQTAQLTTSTNPAAGIPTATTVVLGAGLGGVFLATIGGGLAISTDFIIQSFLNPLGTSLISGKTLYITGFRFDAVNMVVTNLTTPLTYAVGLHIGNTNVNPATAESATNKLNRNIILGVQTLAVNAVAGTPMSPNISVDFSQGPIVINSGEYIQTFIRPITYTATANQALWCYITFIGHWE